MTGAAERGLWRVARFPIALLCWLGQTGLAAAAGKATVSEAPKISVKVGWEFRELDKSQPYADGPMGVWKTSLSLSNNDTRSWTVVPHMVFGEESEKDLNCGGALCVPDAQGEVPLGARPVPQDASGQRRVEMTIRLSPDRFGLSPVDLVADWRSDGQRVRWAATDLRCGGRLDCQWEELSLRRSASFDPQTWRRDGHHLSHLGPIFYDRSKPGGTAYILSVGSAIPGDDAKRLEGAAIEFLALTGDVLRRRIDDAAMKPAWRREYLLLLWRHPRPCGDADAILADIVAKSRLYPDLYENAIRSLAAHGAKAPLVARVRDKTGDSYVRTLCLANLGSMLANEDAAWLSAIEKDPEESDYMRRHAEHMRVQFCRK